MKNHDRAMHMSDFKCGGVNFYGLENINFQIFVAN